MSLDVHLTMPGTDPLWFSEPRIYFRSEGRTREITRAEWDIVCPGVEPVTVTLPESDGEVFWRNITHNLGQMAAECGLYEPLWNPAEHRWAHARDLIEPIQDGLAELQTNREVYEQFNPTNGWGDLDGLLEFAAAYLAACMRWPDAEVYVSR